MIDGEIVVGTGSWREGPEARALIGHALTKQVAFFHLWYDDGCSPAAPIRCCLGRALRPAVDHALDPRQ